MTSMSSSYNGLISENVQNFIVDPRLGSKDFVPVDPSCFVRQRDIKSQYDQRPASGHHHRGHSRSHDDGQRRGDNRSETVCMLCNYKGGSEHLMSSMHNINYERFRGLLLGETPKETSLQMNAIREFLYSSYISFCMNDEMYPHKEPIIWEFQNLLRTVDPNCYCRLLGSHITRTSLTNSDLNIEIVHPNSRLFRKDPRAKNSIHHKLVDSNDNEGGQLNYHASFYDLIPSAFGTLHKLIADLENPYSMVSNLFVLENSHPYRQLNNKVPKLLMKHVPSQTRLEICCYNEASFKLSELLSIYLSMEPRAKELARLLKYWAHICKVDNPNHGTFPPETFIILMIYFLQRTSPPVLPCLHELLPEPTKGGRCTKSDEGDVASASEIFRKISLADNDDDNNLDNKNSDSTNLENGHETVEDDHCDDEEEIDAQFEFYSDEIRDFIQQWVSHNKQPVHVLFIEFLKYMMAEFSSFDNVITIRTLKKVSLVSKNWLTKIKPIENPVKPRTNISRCIGSLRTFAYIKACFERSFYYLTSIPVNIRLKQKVENYNDPQDFIKLYYDSSRFERYFAMRWTESKPGPGVDTAREMIQQNLFARDVNVINALLDQAQMNNYYDLGMLPRSVSNQYFKKLLIPTDHEAAIFCWTCKNCGHDKDHCPKGKIETLNQEFKDYDHQIDFEANLDPLFFYMYQRDTIAPRLSMDHERVTNELSEIINNGINEYELEIHRFGSTANNLGCYDSDLDICITFKGNDSGVGIDSKEILQKVHSVLSKSPKIKNCDCVLSARVPIIRFKYEIFEVDLSMNNRCALYNSELLKLYSKIDERVPILVYLVKKFARVSFIHIL